ncbi:hypothetical protein WAF17_09450 [Bernardetia sp. ABR2-2B]|uniref:hypothetical protein n=1 Tax=Bernardetia sp. ABR2-2B TaxID=3127472 RepID=UPI0030CB0754
MKNFKGILGAILWIIVILIGFYFYQFSNQEKKFISIYNSNDSILYESMYKKYKIDRLDMTELHFYTDESLTERSYPSEQRIYTFNNSYPILDSLKKNNLITLNSIITRITSKVDTQAIIHSELAWIADETTNPKLKYLSKTWLSRIYANAWIDVMKGVKIRRLGFELKRIKGDSLGVFMKSSDIPKIYLDQTINIKEDQNKFSITTHYFGRDTLTVTKNYRITTPKGQKIQPFDYEEIK